MRGIKAGLDADQEAEPQLRRHRRQRSLALAQSGERGRPVPAPGRWDPKAAVRSARADGRARRDLRIGMPRVLNMYFYAPMFRRYLESLGLQPENLVYSEFTGQEMYRQGAGRGAIDPCFPSKIGIPHVYNLIFVKHQKKPLDAIFFPMIDTLHQPLKNCSGSNACPTVTATPNAVKAAFTKESDVFKENGIQYSTRS